MAKGWNSFKAIDAFGKTLDDVKIRTRTGALITFASLGIIFILTLIEFADYRSVYLDTDIVVDKLRDERITVNLNVTFPRVPCFLLSLDVTDISGEHVRDLSHNINKARLDKKGVRISGGDGLSDLGNDFQKVGNTRKADFCGSCFGGLEPEGGCCNTCESVRQAYLNRGWAFSNPEAIEQCVAEQWTEKVKDQAEEGCNISGRVRMKKVASNLQLSPGKSFQSNNFHQHELVPYLRDGIVHDFGHMIHSFRFESDDEYDVSKFNIANRIRKRLGVDVNPLDGSQAHFSRYRIPSHLIKNLMFQYFVKVVGTEFHTMDVIDLSVKHPNGASRSTRQYTQIDSHQYSVTSFARDVSQKNHVVNDEGIELTHGWDALPGLFVSIDVSPMKVVHIEKHKPFAHFLTTFCAIIGGVITVASLIDSAIFTTLTGGDPDER